MDQNIDRIPAQILDRLSGRSGRINAVGMSGAKVVVYPDMVLKCEPRSEESDNEYQMLCWLQGKLPVPAVLDFVCEDGVNYLLMSRLAGVMSCDRAYLTHPSLLIPLMAESLRALWAVEPAGCPYMNDLSKKLRKARERVTAGLVQMEDAEPETYGPNGFRNPMELLCWLESHRPEESLVFSHGDFCLPNLFLQDGRISGFLDLGRAGLADPYQDLALGYRSLKHNSDGTYDGIRYSGFSDDLLFRALGMEPDWEKVRYYILLDELF